MRRPKCFGNAGSSLCGVVGCSDISDCMKKAEFSSFRGFFDDLSVKCRSIVDSLSQVLMDHPHVDRDCVGFSDLSYVPADSLHFLGFTISSEDVIINVCGYTSEDSPSQVLGGLHVPISYIESGKDWHKRFISESIAFMKANIDLYEMRLLETLKGKHDNK